MGIADPRKIVTVPARIVVNPTNLGGSFPYGGTALGLARDVEFVPSVRTKDVTAEEFGGAIVEKYYCCDNAFLAAVLRNWDKDALASVYPSVTEGSDGSAVVKSEFGAFPPGSSLAALASKILLVPWAREPQPNLPALLLYRAIPAIDAAARLQYAIGTEWGLGIAWTCTPDSTGRVWNIGKLGNLAL